MNSPVNRMSQHYAAAALASTIDYVGYCIKRHFPQGNVLAFFREQPVDDRVPCGISAVWGGQAFVVRFRVPIDAAGPAIKMICGEAAESMMAMLRQAGAKQTQ